MEWEVAVAAYLNDTIGEEKVLDCNTTHTYVRTHMWLKTHVGRWYTTTVWTFAPRSSSWCQPACLLYQRA